MAISTDDYVAISQLLGEYCWHVDRGDEAAWTALWTPDGKFGGLGEQPLVGHEQLAVIPRNSLKSGQGKLRHLVANLHARYGDSTDTIHARLYNYVTNWAKGGAPVVLADCEMVLIKVGASWMVKSNAATMLSA